MRTRHDAGITLVEVIVAIAVFTMLTTGAVASVTTSLRMVGEARLRETASNMAAEDLDQVRASSEVTNVQDKTYERTASGRKFTVRRETKGDYAYAQVNACGSRWTGGSPVASNLYKEGVALRVTVSWTTVAGEPTSILFAGRVMPRSVDAPVTDAPTILVVVDSTVTGEPVGEFSYAISQSEDPPYIIAPGPDQDHGGRGESRRITGACALHTLSSTRFKPGRYRVQVYQHESPRGVQADSELNVVAETTVDVVRGEIAIANLSFNPGGFLAFQVSDFAHFPDEPTFTVRTAGKTHAPVRAFFRRLTVPPNSSGYSYAFSAPGCRPEVWSDQNTVEVGQSVDVRLLGGVHEVRDTSKVKTITARSVGACASSLTYTIDNWSNSRQPIALPYGTWEVTAGERTETVTIAPPSTR